MSRPETSRPEVQQEWTDHERAAAWRKWHAQFAYQTRAATGAIVDAAGVRAGMSVLDLASGSGEPALTLAAIAGAAGRVTATDLGQGMLQTIRATVAARGLGNIRMVQAAMEQLPYAGGSFDAATCRFGIMFALDVGGTLDEIRRVLKPGARAAFIAWGPRERNPSWSTTTGILAKYMDIPAPDLNAPEGHRFAEAGSLAAELRAAGFEDVREELMEVPWPWPGTVEEAWQSTRELRGAPMQRNLDRIPPEQSPQVLAEIHAAIAEYYDGREVRFTAALVLASGRAVKSEE